jgi:hypothetical protein
MPKVLIATEVAVQFSMVSLLVREKVRSIRAETFVTVDIDLASLAVYQRSHFRRYIRHSHRSLRRGHIRSKGLGGSLEHYNR